MRQWKTAAWIVCALVTLTKVALAAPNPPSEVRAKDTPNDAGRSIVVSWNIMEGETARAEYLIEVADNPNGPWFEGERTPSTISFQADLPGIFGFGVDTQNTHALKVDSYKIPSADIPGEFTKVSLTNNQLYYLRVSVVDEDGAIIPGTMVVSATAKGNFFAFNKLNNFFLMLFMSIAVLFYIFLAKRDGARLFIRRIAGLEAVEEALGRATEMGKPVFFIHGIAAMDQIATIASINLLSKIAQKVAEFDTTLKVTNIDPIVMAVSQETVKEAYIKSGRPDSYNAENVGFTAADQFSYAAAVEGMMVREKPAANFFMGHFYAESLLLSETGASTGAIQIAGTDAYTQLPFFVTSCDYTLMGEELYAASAYLSREPKLLGSLKAQDVGKAVLIILLLLGSVLSTFGVNHLANMLKSM